MISRKLIFTALLGTAILAAIPPAYHFAQGHLVAPEMPDRIKADAVMIFTGASDRIVEGYETYIKGEADLIMVTGDDFQKEAAEPEVRQLSKKIRRDDIYVDLEAENTIENAEHGAEWAIQQDVGSIVLVTSEDHMPRAFFELRRLLPDNIKIYTESVPGEIRYSGIDSETGRLLCRVYETVTETDFCYKARELAHSMGL